MVQLAYGTAYTFTWNGAAWVITTAALARAGLRYTCTIAWGGGETADQKIAALTTLIGTIIPMAHDDDLLA